LVTDWCAAVTTTPVGSGIQSNSGTGGYPFKENSGAAEKNIRELILRGVCLELRVKDFEADLLAGRDIETGTYQKCVATLLTIKRALGLLPGDRKVSPKSPRKPASSKPGPKPSTMSPHAKAVLAALKQEGGA